MIIMGALRYDSLIESIKSLSLEEKEELRFLIEKYLIEERREKIYNNYQETLKEEQEKKLEYSNDVNKLKRMIDE